MNREQRRAAKRAERKPGKPARRAGLVLRNPVDYVVSGVLPLTGEQQRALGVRCHGALASLATRPGCSQDGADLAAMAEVTHALVEAVLAQARRNGDAQQIQIAGQALAIADAGRRAVLAASTRAARMADRWVLTGPELTALNECVELHDQFLQIAPQQLVEHAVVTAQQRAIAKRDALLRGIKEAA